MTAVKKLWPQCPIIPKNRKRHGCIVALLHVKACVPSHMCNDPWRAIPEPAKYYFVFDKVLPLPTAIHHGHSFRMWTVQEAACDIIYSFILGRKGRLFDFPPIKRPQISTEGYQLDGNGKVLTDYRCEQI